MVSKDHLTGLLSAWLGSALLRVRPQIVTETLRRLNAFVPARDRSADLRDSLEGLLYTSVRDATDGDLCVLLDDGSVVPMEQGDFPILADELMYLIYEQFPTDAHHLMLLREASLREHSLSAIRALYLRFSDYETAEERRTLARIARQAHPAFRWKAWLPEDGADE